MINNRLTVVVWFVLLLIGVGAAASDVPESVRVERVLTADQIDSSTVAVGAFVVVVYGQGERHPVSGAWAKLDTARGFIKAVDSRRLIVGLAPDGWSKWITLERIQTLSLTDAPLSAVDRDPTRTRMSKPVPPAQTEPVAAHSAAKREDAGLRVVKKVAVGTFSGIVFTGMTMGVQDKIFEPYGDPDADAYRTLGFLFFGGAIGCSIGFPFGVSSVDPYDSFLLTLLAGVIPGAAGVGLLWVSNDIKFLLGLSYVVPVISSLIVSETSRDFSQDRRVSFGLSPTSTGGLSAVAQLRF